LPKRVRRAGAIGGLIAVLLVFGLFFTAVFAQPAQAVAYSAEELEFVRLLNAYRVTEGLEPLLISDPLSEAAERHCSDMATYGFFDHYTIGGSDWFPIGASPWDRMAACGYDFRTTKGENLAAGQNTAADVFADWKNSPGHNANMLSPDFRVIGVGHLDATAADYDAYWTTDFGGHIDATAHEAGPPTAPSAAVPSAAVPSADDAAAAPSAADAATPSPSIPAASPVPSPGFSDVGADTLYHDEISQLAALGIVCGYEDGSFRPADPITRQQFAKMIALTLGYDVQPVAAAGFTDVQIHLGGQDPLYPAGYIAACLKAGILMGKSDGSFGPFDRVTRAQLITMVTRAAGLSEPSATVETPFTDFSPDHYPWAAKAWAAGLLDGLSDLGADYAFWANAARAEACVLLCNLLESAGPASD